MTCKECFNYDLCKIVSDKYCELNVITDNVGNVEKYCSLFKSKKEIDTALEKQKPKKTTHEATLYVCHTCPKCKNVVSKQEIWGESKVTITPSYCQFCGQALEQGD